VAVSLVTGLVAALLLVAAPFIRVTESAITGAVLCGFAVGWAVLFLLSRRFTDQPQRWAAMPASVMGVGGLLLLAFGSPMREVLSWVWPPVLLALVVWMVMRVRRDMRSRAGRIQLYLVFLILALCAVGGGWQTVREASDTNPYLTSGRLIDVGGYQLRLDCVGSGGPTVVLEPGAGGTSASMGWIAPAVASQTRVCVYDRAGRGGSQSADRPQDGAQVATDLHTLLHRAGVAGPYVLAGHSFGGLYVRIFAAHYPDEVAGLVLIDSTASEEPAKSVIASTGSAGSYDAVGRFSILASLSARVGLARLYGDFAGGSLPARSEDQLAADTAQASTVRSVVEEYLRGGKASQEAGSLRDLGDKPLVVLTAGAGHPESWMTAQNKKQYAAHTSQVVLDVITSIRNNQPLSR
jgi:pimeloyl-ACP methyl ester carboxylesterase